MRSIFASFENLVGYHIVKRIRSIGKKCEVPNMSGIFCQKSWQISATLRVFRLGQTSLSTCSTMETDEEQAHKPNRCQKRSRGSVYDAVAGRLGYEGFLSEPQPSKHRDTASTSAAAVPPEEVLFRRKGAPERYEEDDFYFADRYLKPAQVLPDSDLLKALHAYASDFYADKTDHGGERDFRSLYETALLALGILIEEAAEEALGKTGHLALVESAEDHDGPWTVGEGRDESSSDLDRNSSSDDERESTEQPASSGSQND